MKDKEVGRRKNYEFRIRREEENDDCRCGTLPIFSSNIS